MRFRRPNNKASTMATTISLDPRLINHNNHRQYGGGGAAAVVEEIEGLIRVTKDGRVERPAIVPCVPPGYHEAHRVASRDELIDKQTGLWARVYIPDTDTGTGTATNALPVVVYFHGGGFCVGSAAWGCYHEFLSALSSRARCVVVSVDYRLAPEHRLPAAYDDGCAALAWAARRYGAASAAVFLGGDSAGANVAYHVAARAGPGAVIVRGLVLIQPFIATGRVLPRQEAAAGSALTVAAAEAYWRMALPAGAGREHPWCDPAAAPAEMAALRAGRVMVCVSEADILRDGNLELCAALGRAGKRVQAHVYGGVGHAFQILNNSQLAQARTREMLSHVNKFIADQ